MDRQKASPRSVAIAQPSMYTGLVSLFMERQNTILSGVKPSQFAVQIQVIRDPELL